jgi:hypothetical protein
MSTNNTAPTSDPCRGLGRSAAEQVSHNLTAALRILDLVPVAHSDLTPHPLVVARAEIKNAQRYCREHFAAGVVSH